MTAIAEFLPRIRLPYVASTIGRKVVMAVSGLVLFGFVLGHFVGNLTLYLGPEAINGYSRFLHGFLHGGGLWVARAVLLACAVLHVWSATSLTLDSWAARPEAYRRWKAKDSTYASRTMRWGGVILFAFIVFHILHLTLGRLHPDYRPGDVYHNVVAGFQVWPVALFYVVAMVLLALHLDHGVWSLCQTLGLSHPRYKRWARQAARAFAVLILVGNCSFPVAVLAGWVR
ncbi:MAG TPA: succinate dehydrogenase cytochrome b subunit [Gemmatimonadales bacterium]|nr:succinate dehydrogenase cytochrome b subunit [Gemmatimonadales bacterium]